MVRLALLVIVWFTPGLSWAGGLEIDLNGLRLQQLVSVVEPALGRPFKTIDEGDLVANAYAIDQEAYMVVGHLKKYPHNISVLQLTGVTARALPFKGLRLGDPGSKVVEVLGKPDDVKEIQSPRVTKLSYEGRNYTVAGEGSRSRARGRVLTSRFAKREQQQNNREQTTTFCRC